MDRETVEEIKRHFGVVAEKIGEGGMGEAKAYLAG